MTPSALLHAVGHAISSGLSSKFFGVATVVIVTRVLGTSDYGYYVLLQSFVSMVGVIYCLSSGSLIQSEIAAALGRDQAAYANDLWRQAARLQLSTFMVAALLGALGYWFLPGASSMTTSDVVIAMIVALGASGLRDFALVTLSASADFKLIARWQFLEGCFRLALVSVGGYLDALPVSRLLLFDSLAIVLAFLVLYRTIGSSVTWTRQVGNSSASLWDVIRSHGKWFAFRTAAVEASNNGRSWLLAGIVSLEAVGAFAVAKRIVQFAKVFMPLGYVLTTYFAGLVHDRTRAVAAFHRGMRLAFYSGLTLALGSMALTPIVAFLLFPQFGMELNYLAWILGLGLLTKSATYVVIAFLNADKKQQFASAMVLTGLGGMLLFAPLLAYWFGAVGIAAESILTALLSCWTGYRLLGRDWPELTFDLKRIVTFSRDDVAAVVRMMKSKKVTGEASE